MARGERGTVGRRGGALALWAVFAVLCLAAATLVVWTSGLVQDFEPFAPPPPPSEPFPGARAALQPLGWRDCPQGIGPGTTATAAGDRTAQLNTRLTERGYVAAEPWSAPQALAAEVQTAGLEGGCGVVAVAVQPGGWIDQVALEGGEPRTPCDAGIVAHAACGSAALRVSGSGMARVRAYSWPGVTERDAADPDLPLDVRLAHLEAATLLSRHAWVAQDEVVVVEPSVGGGRLSAQPPAAPKSGCVPWVAVGVGLGGGMASWDGAHMDSDAPTHRFMLGAVSCAPGGGGADATTLSLTPASGPDRTPRIWFRPYEAGSGPGVGPTAAPNAIETGAMRVVDADDLQLPTAVPP